MKYSPISGISKMCSIFVKLSVFFPKNEKLKSTLKYYLCSEKGYDPFTYSVASIFKIIFNFSFPFCSDFNLLDAFLAEHAVTVTYILHTTLRSERSGARWG